MRFINNTHINEHICSQIISIMTSVLYREQRILSPALLPLGLNNDVNTSNLTSANVSNRVVGFILKLWVIKGSYFGFGSPQTTG